MRIEPVFLFDLDGTLVDSVYQHVLAWKEALDAEGIELSVWRIHRKIGMSGGLFTNQLLRETGLDISVERVERLRQRHLAAYRHYAGDVRPLPGARELLSFLSDARIPWAIATSGRMETAGLNLAALGVDPEQTPVITRDQVKYAKPDPDLFLAAAEKLGAPIEAAIVVGDSIWDMLAATRSASGFSAAATGSTSFRMRVRSASMRTPPTCCCISTRSAGGDDCRRSGRRAAINRTPDASRSGYFRLVSNNLYESSNIQPVLVTCRVNRP